jgi:nickel-dependent lactate racemase
MKLPLGDGHVEVRLPDCETTVAEPPGGDPVDVRRAARRAVANPHGPRLRSRVDPGDDVAVVVTDLTREAPDDVLLSTLLSELEAGGVDREDVTVVIGLGLHRPMDDGEIVSMIGEHAHLARNHDPDETVEVGRVDDCPVLLHEAVANADQVVSTGVVEPHQYAGFSGGAKTAAIGVGGEPLIRYTHGPEVLSESGVRLGRLEGNAFRSILDRAGDCFDPFCCNVTKGPSGVLGVSAGDHRAVVRDLAGVAREALSVPVREDYDAVVAGVGAPKDATLYQATRAATYVALGDRNPLERSAADDGGRIVIPAELGEGAGQGAGERRFYDRLSGAEDAGDLYHELREGYEPGAQRAFVVARTLTEHDVSVTDSERPDVVEECLMRASETVESAVEPGSDVLVVPDALNSLLTGRRG